MEIAEFIKRNGSTDSIRRENKDDFLDDIQKRFPDMSLKDILGSYKFLNRGEKSGVTSQNASVFITQDDLPLIIDEPGVYILEDDAVYDPIDGPGGIYTAAITILSDDVTLDLCNHTLSQINDSVTDVYGVQIGYGLFPEDRCLSFNNITIKNGTIRDFVAVGIFANNLSFSICDEPVEFTNLHFLNLNILRCGSLKFFNTRLYFGSAINLDSNQNIPQIIQPSDPVAYNGVLIEDCSANDCFGINSSIYTYTSDNLVIRNTQSNNFIADLFGGFGYSIRGRNIQMFKCQGNNVQYFTDGGQCGGLDIERSQNIYVKDCQFNDAYGENAVIVNSNLSTCKNSIYENCQFNNARGGDGSLIIAGMHMSDSINGTVQGDGYKFTNCQFNGASISDNNPGGTTTSLICGVITVTQSNMVFENCQSSNIDSTNNPGYNATGIFIGSDASDVAFGYGGVNNLTVVNSVFSDITSHNESIGLRVPSTTRNRTGRQSISYNTVIRKCIAERVHSSTTDKKVAGISQDLYVFGPFNEPDREQSVVMKNLSIRDCTVSDVKSGSGNPLSSGILVESVINPILINNTVNDSDRGILFTGSDKIEPNAFQIAATYEDATTFPPLPINLISTPFTNTQVFKNITRNNSATFERPDVDFTLDFIYPKEDLTLLGWKVGDEIIYDNQGDTNLNPLVNGQKYYVIVYRDGYCERGLVSKNDVSNCLVSGYQDNKTPCTSSSWLSNTAYCNGKNGKHNYEINWGSKKHIPVAKGNLSCYPKPKYHIENISISCDKCDCHK